MEFSKSEIINHVINIQDIKTRRKDDGSSKFKYAINVTETAFLGVIKPIHETIKDKINPFVTEINTELENNVNKFADEEGNFATGVLFGIIQIKAPFKDEHNEFNEIYTTIFEKYKSSFDEIEELLKDEEEIKIKLITSDDIPNAFSYEDIEKIQFMVKD